jgi:hypothetical protein
MKSEYFVSIGFFIVFFVTSLLFPFQVILNFKYFPLILPLLLFPLIFFISRFKVKYIFRLKKRFLFVIYYLLFFFIHELFKVYHERTSLSEFFRLGFIYVYPVAFFLLGLLISNNMLFIKSALYGILFASIIGLIFIIIDNLGKFVFDYYTEYSKLACNYIEIVNREFSGNSSFVEVSGRCYSRNRSFGLLESPQISVAQVVFGMIITFSGIIKFRKRSFLLLLGFWYFAIISCLNFTNIAISSLLVVLYLIQFRNKVDFRMLFVLFFISILFIAYLAQIQSDVILNLVRLFNYQVDLLLGNLSGSGYSGVNFFSDSLNRLFLYALKLYEEKCFSSLLFGLGFSESSLMAIGGDFGYVESFGRFGAVGVLIILIYMFFLLRTYFCISSSTRSVVFNFSFGIINVVLASEIHYSTYLSKSILPILFFAIGVCPRFK